VLVRGALWVWVRGGGGGVVWVDKTKKKGVCGGVDDTKLKGRVWVFVGRGCGCWGVGSWVNNRTEIRILHTAINQLILQSDIHFVSGYYPIAKNH